MCLNQHKKIIQISIANQPELVRMKKEIVIDRGNPDHLAEIQRLFVDTISSVCNVDYNAEQIKVWTSSIENKERWDDIISNQYVLIAKYDESIVGFATLSKSNYIDLFYVHKDFQGLKIASLLYYNIELEVLRNGQSEISADVSITARPFFEKMGFQVLKEQTVFRQNVEFINYKMKKVLFK